MKKYNMSEIMTKAWTIFRKSTGKTFGECLKKAWALTKAVVNFAPNMNKMLDAYLTVTNSTENAREIDEQSFVGTLYFTDSMGRNSFITLCPKTHNYRIGGCRKDNKLVPTNGGTFDIPKTTLQKVAALVKASK